MKLLLTITTDNILHRDGNKIRCMIFKGRPYIGEGSLVVCDETGGYGIYIVLESECPSDPGDQHFFTAKKICELSLDELDTSSTESMCRCFAKYNDKLKKEHNKLPFLKRIFDFPSYVPKDFADISNFGEYKGFS